MLIIKDINAEPRLQALITNVYPLYKVWPSFNVGLDQAG